MLKVMLLFFSNLCVQVLNCFVHSIAEYHWVQTCFITTTTTSSRNLQKSREITAVLQKVSILGVESLFVIAFCAWIFQGCKKDLCYATLGVNRISIFLEILHWNSLNLLNKSSTDLNMC